jgi:hypothetical protein
MTKVLLASVGLALAASAAFCGCSDRKAAENAPEPKAQSRPTSMGAPTPQAAVLNWLEALETFDRDLYMSSINVPQDFRQYIETEADGLLALNAWLRRMRKTYGEDCLDGDLFSRPLPSPQAVADQLVVEQWDGNVAVTVPDVGVVPVIKSGDAWLVSLLPTDITMETRASNYHTMRARAIAFKAVAPLIGKSGYDAQSLRAAWHSALIQAGDEQSMPVTPGP